MQTTRSCPSHEPVNLFHPLVLTPVLIVVVMVLLVLIGQPIDTRQVLIILIGMALWDFGWHARAHHSKQWIAHWSIRLLGLAIATTGAVL